MYSIKFTHQFKKSLRLCLRRGLDVTKVQTVIGLLQRTGTLPDIYRPHHLSGSRGRQMEAHIEPDWLIVWETNEKELILYLIDTGTHSDLFKR